MKKVDYVFVDKRNEKTDRIPFFCPVCDFMIRTYDDKRSYEEKKCCYKCALVFADSRIEEWKNGWRPSEKELKEEIEKRLAVPVSIDLSSLGDS